MYLQAHKDFEEISTRKKMMGGLPQPLRVIGAATATIFGGMLALSLASSVTMRMLRAAVIAKHVRNTSSPLCKLIYNSFG